MDFKKDPAGVYVSFPGGFVISPPSRHHRGFVLDNRLGILDETGPAVQTVHETLQEAVQVAEGVVAADPERFAEITAEGERILRRSR